MFMCPCIRYYAVIVVVGGGESSSADMEDIGPYNREEAGRANSNGQPYTYIAGIVETSDISDYPYPYIVGDESRSSIGGIDYENVPLQSNTMYAILVRAHATNDLVSDNYIHKLVYSFLCIVSCAKAFIFSSGYNYQSTTLCYNYHATRE